MEIYFISPLLAMFELIFVILSFGKTLIKSKREYFCLFGFPVFNRK